MTAAALNNPFSIDQHIEEMAASTRGAVLTLGRRQVYGELGYPHPITGETTFLIHPALHGLVAPPASGKTVLVEYQTHQARFAFMTSISGRHTDALWRLERPNTIQQREIRKHRRRALGGFFREAGGGYHELTDISVGGVGLRSEGPPWPPGKQLRGFVDLDGLPPTPVLLVVRHARKSNGGSVSGCTFEHIHPYDLAALQQFLANT